MRPLLRFLYHRLLRLYPHTFRAAFADEMLGVFAALLAEQAGRELPALRDLGAASVSWCASILHAGRTARSYRGASAR